METWHLTFYPSFWCLRSEQLKILVHSAVFRQHCTKQFFCSITQLLIMLFFAAVNSICLSLNIKVKWWTNTKGVFPPCSKPNIQPLITGVTPFCRFLIQFRWYTLGLWVYVQCIEEQLA